MSRPPRPAGLALGVAAAAAAATLSRGGGAAGSGTAVLAAAAIALAIAAAACGSGAANRGRWAEWLAVAALGAVLLSARLAAGVVVGVAAPDPGGAPATASSGGRGPAPVDETGTWQGRVVAVRLASGQQVATLAIADPPLTCSGDSPAYPRLTIGDTVRWTGRLRPLADSDYGRWLASQGVAVRCDATSLTLVAHDDSPAGRLEQFRQASGDALQRVLPEPEGGLSAAILIGLRDRVDKAVAADFTTAGVSHIVAISGWNIAIVAATVASLLGGLGRRRRSAVTIVAIAAYTLFAGASPSVVRAAAMAAAALLALESGRGPRVTVSLAWAVAAILAVSPATVGDVGFQLSAAATAGLVAWGTPLTRFLEDRTPWLPAWIREILGVSLAAQAATLPIALLAFGRLAPIAPAANLVAVPLVPPAMAAGAVAFGAGWLAVAGAPGWLIGLLAMPAWALLSVLIAVVHAAASIPGANTTLPFPANAVAAAAACLMLAWLHHRATKAAPRRAGRPPAASSQPPHRPARTAARSRLRWAVVAAGFVVVLSGGVVAARPDGSVHVVVLDVGQGDAILLEGDRGSRILVDGGPDGGVLVRALDSFVPAWDRRLDTIVLTHPHEDHAAGLATVVARYRVGQAFESGWPADGPGYRAWLDSLAARGIEPGRLGTGDLIRLDDCSLRVLWPDDGSARSPALDFAASDNRKANDASIVLLGEYESRRFLLTGDAEDDVDPILLARGLPAVDMLKVAHHGSATATSEALLSALQPGVAVVSVGADNSYGHPAPSTMARLRAHAAQVLRTDQVGTVEVTIDAAGVRASVFGRDGKAALGTATDLPTRFGLLYDSIDVRPRPPRERGPAAFSGAAAMAPASFAGRGRDGGLAGLAGGIGRPIARSPPR
jgi:competence protein ComEC